MRKLSIISALFLVFTLSLSAGDKDFPEVVEREDIRSSRLVATPGKPLELVIEFTKEKAAEIDGNLDYAKGGLIIAGIKLKIPQVGTIRTTAGVHRFVVTPPDISSTIAILDAISDPVNDDNAAKPPGVTPAQ